MRQSRKTKLFNLNTAQDHTTIRLHTPDKKERAFQRSTAFWST